jgi:hypothetical protein
VCGCRKYVVTGGYKRRYLNFVLLQGGVFLFNKKLCPEGRLNSQVAKQLAECGEAAFLMLEGFNVMKQSGALLFNFNNEIRKEK